MRTVLLLFALTAAEQNHAEELVPLSAVTITAEFPQPSISPDGKQLVYLDRRTGNLLAVNVDGKEHKVLGQNGRAGSSQFQDGIIDKLRNDPRNVLIQLEQP